jgi:hypothetical protein
MQKVKMTVTTDVPPLAENASDAHSDSHTEATRASSVLDGKDQSLSEVASKAASLPEEPSSLSRGDVHTPACRWNTAPCLKYR